MSAPLFLSRARLRRDAPATALRALLVPRDDSERLAAGHRLVWTLFGDNPDRTRDFLWREAEPGLFYLLSARQPRDEHGLFELDDPKLFSASFSAGMELHFVLRANATVARGAGGARSKPCDVVMDALYAVPQAERASVRWAVTQRAGREWLEGQGAKAGFRLASGVNDEGDYDEDEAGSALSRSCLRVTSYQALRLPRGGKPARIGVLDLEGTLEVTDPELFAVALERGFGRAKAFGCGLMLVRRA